MLGQGKQPFVIHRSGDDLQAEGEAVGSGAGGEGDGGGSLDSFLEIEYSFLTLQSICNIFISNTFFIYDFV